MNPIRTLLATAALITLFIPSVSRAERPGYYLGASRQGAASRLSGAQKSSLMPQLGTGSHSAGTMRTGNGTSTSNGSGSSSGWASGGWNYQPLGNGKVMRYSFEGGVYRKQFHDGTAWK